MLTSPADDREIAPETADIRPSLRLVMSELMAGLVSLALRHVDCDVAAGQGDGRADLLLIDLDRPALPSDGARGKVGLTRRWDARVRLRALGDGFDELVHVPFAPDEVVVRTATALRRATGHEPRILRNARLGRFEADIFDGTIRLDGNEVRLTLLERTLLYVFLAHPGRVVSRREILDDVWGGPSVVTSNVIDRHIRDLRVKLREHWREPHLIETVPGMGYRFIGQAAM